MKISTLITLILYSTFLFSQEHKKEIVVKDSSEYDIGFIKYWNHLEDYNVVLSNDSIIIGGDKNNAIIIPTDLPLKQNIKYLTFQNSIKYELIVNRLNYTNIYYSIVGTKNQNIVFKRKGTAVLESSFYLGSEGVYEKSEDEIYGMNDYNINNSNNHMLLIPSGTIDIINYYGPNKQEQITLRFKKSE